MSNSKLLPTQELNAPDTAPRASVPAPSEIGAYRLLRVLGQGGMGVVYLAERSDGQYEQRVALKILPSWAKPSDKGRFLRERQFLARMEHKNIARLLGGGLTADGTPYFALEFVDGEPLTAFAARHQLKLSARIELFLKICNAVHYAHQHLIIHRDLKPSNVLVDADGEPKLLDFGIAKAVDTTASVDADSDPTQTATRLMTPAYAAPEQILAQAVSTLTDVYSLGVVLHELLLGERPHPYCEGVLPEAQIVQDEVATPSTRQSLVPSVAARELRGDLDLILLTALKREPARRYTSVEALAKDLRAFLDGRPIAARGDTWTYRLSMLIARNRAASLAAVLAGVALLAAVAVSLVLAEQAQREATRAEAVKDFLVGMFESSDPNVRGAAAVTARELLDAASQRANTRWTGNPDTARDISLSIATAYNRLGLFDSALKLLSSGSGRAEIELERAIALKGLGEFKPAQRAASEAATLALADGKPAVAVNAERELVALSLETGDLAAAQARLERVLPSTKQPEQRVALSLDLARIFSKSDRAMEAQKVAEAALAEARASLGNQHTVTADALTELATILDGAGHREAAARCFSEALVTLNGLLGPAHLKVLQARDAYGFFLLRSGDSEGAKREIAGALEIARASYGARHRVVGQLKVSLSTLYARQGELVRAEALAREALLIQREVYGSNSLEVLECLNILATILGNARRYGEANVLFAESIRVAATLPPMDQARKLSSIEHKAANLLRQQDRCGEAVPMFQRVLERESRPESSFSVEPTHARLSECELVLGDSASALTHAAQAYAIAESPKGVPAHRSTTLLAYARALLASGDRARARTLAQEAMQASEKQLGRDSPSYLEAAKLVGEIAAK